MEIYKYWDITILRADKPTSVRIGYINLYNKLYLMFDLSSVKLSGYDKKVGVIIPKEPSAELAEFVGIMIGDGHIYRTGCRYVMGITGNANLEYPYYEYIKKLIKTVWNKDVKIKRYGTKLTIVMHSKGIQKFLLEVLGLSYGASQNKTIPDVLINEGDLVKHTIRGIADTDGSIFVADKPGSPGYPSIEITTTSKTLAYSIKDVLVKRGFRVAKIWTYCSKRSKLTTYKVPLNGFENLMKWKEEIGFSNQYKSRKIEEVLKRKMGQGGFEPPIVEGQINS